MNELFCPDCKAYNRIAPLTQLKGQMFCKGCGYYKDIPPYRITPRCGHVVPLDITDEMLLKENIPCRYCLQESGCPSLLYIGLTILLPLLFTATAIYFY